MIPSKVAIFAGAAWLRCTFSEQWTSLLITNEGLKMCIMKNDLYLLITESYLLHLFQRRPPDNERVIRRLMLHSLPIVVIDSYISILV